MGTVGSDYWFGMLRVKKIEKSYSDKDTAPTTH